eukprot:PITA_19060
MASARVQAVAQSGFQSIPSEFVWPVYEGPARKTFNEFEIPLIDLSSLQVDELREKTVAEIGRLSEEWGIFQVVNHGIPDELVQRLQAAGREFFDLPLEEKEPYANLDGVTDDRFEGEVTEEYGRQVLGVVDKLLSAISLNLGLEDSTVRKALGGENLELELKINYYPACPQPDMALGVLPHTDLSALTVLKPNDVPGLQILRNNEWVTVKHAPDTLIIHIGDQLQTLSNGRYKSILHRTLVSEDKVRMSWPVFCNPPLDLVVGPLQQSIDENHPPLFDAMTHREFRQRKKTKANQKTS